MIKAAIIGAGAIAGVHAEAFIRFPELCEVRAVCDIYVEKAQDLMKSTSQPGKGLQDHGGGHRGRGH